jgi:hypothetical protein
MNPLTDKEQKDFRDMITACGRSPDDFSISIKETSGSIAIINNVKHKSKEYSRDAQGSWILKFATDLKLGEF